MKRHSALACILLATAAALFHPGNPRCHAGPFPPFIVTPRTTEADAVFRQLRRKGLRVFFFQNLRPSRWELAIPQELCFKPIDARTLIETVAAKHELKVAWAREGRCAVFYNGATDADLERIRKDLASAEASVRHHAVRRCHSLADIRAIPWLVDAAKDQDAELRRLARAALSANAGMEAALAIDERVLELISADLDSKEEHWWAALPLLSLGGEKELALLEKVLNDPDRLLRSLAAFALGKPGGEKALSFIETMGDNTDNNASPQPGTQIDIESELGGLNRERVLPLLKIALAGPDVVARQQAAKALGLVGTEDDLPLLESLLADRNGTLSWYAAEAIAHIAGESALPLLEKALPNSNARNNVFEALRLIGGDKARALVEKEFLDPNVPPHWNDFGRLAFVGNDKALAHLELALTGIVPGEDGFELHNRRYSAVRALAQIGGEKAVPLLAKALDDKIVRAYTIDELGRPQSEKAVDLLDAVISNGDPKECASACRALSRIGTDAARQRLEKLLANPSDWIRGHAALALATGGQQRAVKYLEPAFANPEKDVRYQGLLALRDMRGEQVMSLLEKAIADQDTDVVNTAAAWLSQIGDDRALALLETRLHDPVPRIRFYIASQLGYCVGRNPKVIALLVKFLADPDAEVRGHAAQALKMIGGEKACAILEKLLSDPDAGTRNHAAGALLDSGTPEALAKLEPLLADPDISVRNTAAIGQLRRGGAKASALLEKLLADPEPAVRINAVYTLKQGSEAELAKLEKALEDGEATVRLAAVNVLKDLDSAKAIELLEVAVFDANSDVRKHSFYALLNFGGVNVCGTLGNALINERNKKLRELMADAVESRYPEVPAIKLALQKLRAKPPVKPPTAPPGIQF